MCMRQMKNFLFHCISGLISFNLKLRQVLLVSRGNKKAVNTFLSFKLAASDIYYV